MLWALSEAVELMKSIKSSKIFPRLHSATLCAERTVLSCLHHCMAGVEADDKWRKVLLVVFPVRMSFLARWRSCGFCLIVSLSLHST